MSTARKYYNAADAEAGIRYTYDLLGTRETKISRPQDVKKINQIFLNYIGITIVII